MLPTMFRELLRSTLYSSSRLFSSSATRRFEFFDAEDELVAGLSRGKAQNLFYLLYHKIEVVE